MPVQTTTVTIKDQANDRSVQITQFPAGRGLRIKVRLLKLILPVAGGLLSGGSSDTKSFVAAAKSKLSLLDQDINWEKAFLAVSEVADPDVVYQLLLDLLASTMIDGKLIDAKSFDDLFIANYGLAYKVAWEVIKANGFFDLGGIGSLLESLPTNTPKS